MSELEDKLGSLLNNPQLMSQLMGMAQNLSAAAPPSPGGSPPPVDEGQMKLIGSLSSLAQSAGLDAGQQELLHALSPYLSNQHLGRLEKAMRAARLARAASSALGTAQF